MKKLYYGDNLQVLRDSIKSESVDLIYLDPPFNSQANYNVLFKTPQGEKSEAQITAFEDTWTWGIESENNLDELKNRRGELWELLDLLVRTLGKNSLSAYLVMMAIRLVELHRVLKKTGSLYLHCDPTASHYLKMILDIIFGAKNFRNEIIWKRTSAHANVGKRCGIITDSLLFYTNSNNYIWNQQYTKYSEEHTKTSYRYIEEDTGRRYASRDLTASMQRVSSGQLYEWKNIKPPKSRCWAYTKENMEKFEAENKIIYSSKGYPRLKVYLDEMQGIPLQNLWDDIKPITSHAKEKLGYPTQKPLALLERIINASSNPNDVILDPFCGCGTAIEAAEKLGRNWIGIDITHLAISIIKQRLKDAFPDKIIEDQETKKPTILSGIQFEVEGTPKDLNSALDLFNRDAYQFQWWAISLVNAQPYQNKKKGADTGIDGLIYFSDWQDTNTKKGDIVTKKIIISVKGGKNINASMIRDLIGTMNNNKAEIGIFITLTPPTQPMIKEAAKAGFYSAGNGQKYSKIQVLTIEELLIGNKRAEYFDFSAGELNFKKAQLQDKNEQKNLFDN